MKVWRCLMSGHYLLDLWCCGLRSSSLALQLFEAFWIFFFFFYQKNLRLINAPLICSSLNLGWWVMLISFFLFVSPEMCWRGLRGWARLSPASELTLWICCFVLIWIYPLKLPRLCNSHSSSFYASAGELTCFIIINERHQCRPTFTAT